MYSDVDCPYCDKGNEINHDDGYGYEEGRVYEQECSGCDKIFVYTTSISFYYEAEKAACLNGGEHIFEPTMTYPKKYTKMCCTMCDKTRQPTEDELTLILAKVKDENFK